MICIAMPLDGLVNELFDRAPRQRGSATVGWLLALTAHAASALFFSHCERVKPSEASAPPVDVEFVVAEPAPPEPPAPVEPAPPAPADFSRAAPPAAARAGALHLAKPEASPTPQAESAVDFTTDPNSASFGGGVVAVGGTAAFGVSGARPSPAPGADRAAPAHAGPVGEALTPASDLSRKPRLATADPCRGFFPNNARDDAGDVSLLVAVSKSGRVANAQLLSESPLEQGFGAAARTCLTSQTFIPALDRQGIASGTAIRVNIRFSR